jgi:chromate transporter
MRLAQRPVVSGRGRRRELTPGPIVITVAFIGYLVAAFPGALAAAIGVFLPVYLFVVVPFPWFDRISANPRVEGFVTGVTAAASGTIAGACFVPARRAIVDVATLVIGAVALVVACRFKSPSPCSSRPAPRPASSSSRCDRRTV